MGTDDNGPGHKDPERQPPNTAEPLAERVGAIEAEQQRQGGILERIEQALSKGDGPKDPGNSSPTSPDTGPGSVAEQVRKGVEEIEAEKQRKADAEARENADKAWRASVDERLPERKPSEPATGRKAKLQARLFGKPDPR